MRATTLGLLSAAAMVAGLTQPAIAAPTVATTATVVTSVSSVADGGTVKVTGTLRAGTTALSGRSVSLQQRVAGTTTWRALRTGTTDVSGRFSATTGALHLDRQFRLHFAGTTRYVAADSSAKQVTVRQWVKVATKPGSTPIVGSALLFTGTTSSALAGALVHLQLASGTTWTTVATSQVAADRTYSVKGKATVAGLQQYRVAVDRKLGAGAAASFPSLFTVSAWYYLADLDGVESRGEYTMTATVAATTYYHAVVLDTGWGDTYATFNLSYKCTRFRSATGTVDSSKVAEASHNVVALDGDEVLTADTAIGQVNSVDLDTTGSFRMTLRSEFPTGAGALVGWGDARILCAGKP